MNIGGQGTKGKKLIPLSTRGLIPCSHEDVIEKEKEPEPTNIKGEGTPSALRHNWAN
jgi:hypothetical protein